MSAANVSEFRVELACIVHVLGSTVRLTLAGGRLAKAAGGSFGLTPDAPVRLFSLIQPVNCELCRVTFAVPLVTWMFPLSTLPLTVSDVVAELFPSKIMPFPAL